MAATTTDEKSLYLPFRFQVEMEGKAGSDPIGWFCECSGLNVKVPAILYREGGSPPEEVMRLPCWTEYGDVTLRYGITNEHSQALWDWMNQSCNIKEWSDEKKTVNIILLDQAGDTGRTWTLYEAWPTEWHAAPFAAYGTDSQKVAIESLTLVFAKMTVKNG
jgi:phage tail-like protein